MVGPGFGLPTRCHLHGWDSVMSLYFRAHQTISAPGKPQLPRNLKSCRLDYPWHPTVPLPQWSFPECPLAVGKEMLFLLCDLFHLTLLSNDNSDSRFSFCFGRLGD